MKNILVLGATGQLGKQIIKKFREQPEISLSVYVRNPQKFENVEIKNIKVFEGNILESNKLCDVMKNQEIVICSLEGDDVLTLAENIVETAKKANVRRIIWMTGMGIHGEIKGVRGIMLGMIAKSRPEYIKAADLIASSGIPYTLLRGPMLRNGGNETYYLTTEKEQPKKNGVDRIAIAKCMLEMVIDRDGFGINESFGITN